MFGFLRLASAKLLSLLPRLLNSEAAGFAWRSDWQAMHVRTLGTSIRRRSSPPVALLATAAFFGGTVVAMAAIAFASMMADAADEHEHLSV